MNEPARLLWITDPWNALDHPRDTTLRLIEASVELGVPSFWADVRTLSWDASGSHLSVRRVTHVSAGRASDDFTLDPSSEARPTDFSHVLYRVDPPVDLAYLHPLELMALDREQRIRAEGGCRTEFVNSLEVLQAAGEKTMASVLPGLFPPSLAACAWERLRAFGELEGTTIAKPLHSCQSRGVELLRWDDPAEHAHNRAVLEPLTDGFRRPALLQRFLPGVRDGETRLWFLDAELLAFVRKKPAQGTYRIDMDHGATLSAHELNAAEHGAIGAISAELRRRGIRHAAVDLIDGMVTDLNVTSPGLLPGMEGVLGRNLARPVIQALLARP